jgi:flagellar assembly factor FliW
MTSASSLVSQSAGTQLVETRFGHFAGQGGDIVTLVDGLPGFESCRRFLLLTSPALEPLTCLQGLDDACPAFLAIDPRLVHSGYTCELDDLQRRRLGATADTPLLWLSIVHVVDTGLSTANLRAPLVVNPERMCGLQLLAGHDEYGTQHPLG